MQHYQKDIGSSADAPLFSEYMKVEPSKMAFTAAVPAVLSEEAQKLIQALKEHYAKEEYILMPEVQTDVRLPISDAFVELVLVEKQKTHKEVLTQEEVNPVLGEASLGIDSAGKAFYNNHIPLFTQQLFHQVAAGKDNSQIIQKVFVEARAGAGKTTLCHHLTYRWGTAEAIHPHALSHFDVVFWLKLRSLPSYIQSCPRTDDEPSLAGWLTRECLSDTAICKRFKLANTKDKLKLIEDLLYPDDTTSQPRCLLILDGWDEVAHFQEESSNEARLLKEGLDYPNLLLTSRPSQKGHGLLRTLTFDREVENVGFSDTGIATYIQRHFMGNEEAARVLSGILKNQLRLQEMAHVPVLCVLICCLHSQGDLQAIVKAKEEQLASLEVTNLYKALRAYIFKQRIPSGEVERKDWSPLQWEGHYQVELKLLRKLAFEQYNANGAIHFSRKSLDSLLHGVGSEFQCTTADLVNTGLLRQIGVDFAFFHLSFQEFLAAEHLLNQLSPENRESHPAQFQSAFQCIQANKYKPRYHVVIEFLLELAGQAVTQASFLHGSESAETIRAEKTCRYLWDALFTQQVDIVGLAHQRLMLSALEHLDGLTNIQRTAEAGSADAPPVKRTSSWVEIFEGAKMALFAWLDNSLTSFKLHGMIQTRLIQVLVNYPKIAVFYLAHLQGRWGTLDSNQQSLALSQTVMPLLSIAPETSTLVLDALETWDEIRLTALLQAFPWKISSYLSQVLQSEFYYRLIVRLGCLLEDNVRGIPFTIQTATLMGELFLGLQALVSTNSSLLENYVRFIEMQVATYTEGETLKSAENSEHATSSIIFWFNCFLPLAQGRLDSAVVSGLWPLLEIRLLKVAHPEHPLAVKLIKALCEVSALCQEILGRLISLLKNADLTSEAQQMLLGLLKPYESLLSEKNRNELEELLLQQIANPTEGNAQASDTPSLDVVENKKAQLKKLILMCDNFDARKKTVKCWKEWGWEAEELVEELLAKLRDKKREVRGHAICVLGELSFCVDMTMARRVIEALLAQLVDEEMAFATFKAISQFSSYVDTISLDMDTTMASRVIDALLAGLGKSEGLTMSDTIVYTLGQLSPHIDMAMAPRVIDTLLTWLGETKSKSKKYGMDAWWVRKAAAEALDQLSSHVDTVIAPRVIDALLVQLKNWKNRSESLLSIAKALGQLFSCRGMTIEPQIIDALLVELRNTNKKQVNNNGAIVNALGQLSSYLDTTTKLRVIDALLMRFCGYCEGEAAALGQLSSHIDMAVAAARVIDALLGKLKSFSLDSRSCEAAANALGQLSLHMDVTTAPLVIDALLARLEGENWYEKCPAAAEVLISLSSYWDMITAPRMIKALLVWLADEKHESLRKAAANALGQLSSHMDVTMASLVIDALLARLRDKESQVCKASVKALGQLSSHFDTMIPLSIEAWMVRLKEQNWDIRKGAVRPLINHNGFLIWIENPINLQRFFKVSLPMTTIEALFDQDKDWLKTIAMILVNYDIKFIRSLSQPNFIEFFAEIFYLISLNTDELFIIPRYFLEVADEFANRETPSLIYLLNSPRFRVVDTDIDLAFFTLRNTTTQAAYTKRLLSLRSRYKTEAKTFLRKTLNCYQQQPALRPTIEAVLEQLNVPFEELLTAIKENLSVQEKGEIIASPNRFVPWSLIASFTLKNGMPLIFETSTQLTLVSILGDSTLVLPLEPTDVQQLVRAIQDELQAFGLAHLSYSHALFQPAQPTIVPYHRRSSLGRGSSMTFFQAGFSDVYPLVPLEEINYGCVMQRSRSTLDAICQLPYRELKHDDYYRIAVDTKNYGFIKITLMDQAKQIDQSGTAVAGSAADAAAMPSKANILREALQTALTLERVCVGLDLSGNELVDGDICIIARQLDMRCPNLRYLRLSKNQLSDFQNPTGLVTLLGSVDGPIRTQLRYLWLDHNLLHASPEYLTDELPLILERNGIVHCDVTGNYLPEGQLLPVPARLKQDLAHKYDRMASEATLMANGVTPELQRCVARMIYKSTVIHSELQQGVSSLLFPDEDPVKKLYPGNALIAFMAYPLGLLLSGGHAFIVVERMISEYGQREFIIADLRADADNDDQIFIQLYRAKNPEVIFSLTKGTDPDYTRHYIINEQQVNEFLAKVIEDRGYEGGMEYRFIPNLTRVSQMNCVKWATKRLLAIGLPIEESIAPGAKKPNCLIV